MENKLNYQLLGVFVLLVFYGIYFTKMLLQRKQGIKTNQLGAGKDRSVQRVENLTSLSTVTVVVAQLVSMIFDWNYIPGNARLTGFLLGIIGDIIFFVAVYTMKDSWRAGIPENDETQMVTGGIFRYSRNPAFLGFDFMYMGVLLMFFNPILVIFTLFPMVMLHLQILQEEQFLKQRFGDQYTEYKKHTFRYLGRR